MSTGITNGGDPAAVGLSAEATPPDRFPLLTLSELRQLPPATYLVDGLLPTGFSVLYGGSGSGKTFVALDLALSIAAGHRWFDRSVERGRVVFLAGEGAAGLGQRVDAWERERGVKVDDDAFLTVPLAANLLDSKELAKANRTLSGLSRVSLIVVDTLARHMPGGDENSAKDMGRFVQAVDHLRSIHESSALALHHTGKNGSLEERGSSSLRGAADASLKLDATDGGMTLKCSKMKEGEPFPTLHLQLVTDHGSKIVRPGTATNALSSSEKSALNAVVRHRGQAGGMTAKEVETAAGTSKSTTNRALRVLLKNDYVTKGSSDQGALWRPTDTGRDLIVPRSPTQSRGTTASESHPSQSVGGGTRDSSVVASGDEHSAPSSGHPERPRTTVSREAPTDTSWPSTGHGPMHPGGRNR